MSDKGCLLFSAVGDIALGDHPMCVGFGAASRFRHEKPDFPFEYVKGLLRDSDLCFGNLECTHSSKGLKNFDYASIQMRGKPSDIIGLARSGFHVLNVANNHSLQHGKEAFLETTASLESSGLRVCGASPSDHLRAEPTVADVNGVKVGFLGYSLRPRQYFEYPPLYTEGHLDGIIADVRHVKAIVDVVVVSLHWGDEFIEYPSPDDVQMARQIIDAGASLILGHHPHVLRGIELYQEGVIAYSLGNFVCDMVWHETLRTSAILQCRIGKRGVSDVELVPIYIDEDYRPRPVPGPRADVICRKLDTLSSEVGAEVRKTFDREGTPYMIAADQANRDMRRRSHLFFLRNAWRYPKRILLQQLRTYGQNRIHEMIQTIRR